MLPDMMITRHNPETAPAVRPTYSQVVRVEAGGMALLFISGLVGVDSNGTITAPGDPAGQADQVYANLTAVLASQGATLEHVVKTTSFVKAGVDAALLRGRSPFPDHARPAASAVFVAGLMDPGWLIEVEAVAVVPASALGTTGAAAQRTAGPSRSTPRTWSSVTASGSNSVSHQVAPAVA